MVTITSLDLNLVLVLHAVLGEGSVARAADRLHVTPSAVSNALARLRTALGDPLVIRRGRGIVPTPRAQELAPAIASAIEEIEGALSGTPFDPLRCTRTFTLAVADAGQVAWVPRLAAAMRRELPSAHLRVIGIDTLVSLGDLASPEIDLHVGVPGSGAGLHVERLFEEGSVLVARRGHAAARSPLSRRALGELRHVRVQMVTARHFADPYAAVFARARVPREIVATVPSFSAAAEVVAATDLVTILPASFLAAKSRGPGLTPLALPLTLPTTAIAMNWHERTHSDPAARAFRELVRRVVLDGATTTRGRGVRSPARKR